MPSNCLQRSLTMASPIPLLAPVTIAILELITEGVPADSAAECVPCTIDSIVGVKVR